MTEIVVTVQNVTYRNPESGYTVLRVQPAQPAQRQLFAGAMTAVGQLHPEPYADEQLTLEGEWTQHPKFGEQFKINHVRARKPPADANALIAYLGSGIFPWVGTATACEIVRLFGETTADVLSSAPERLVEVRGITAERAAEIGKVWQEQQATREAMTYLCGLGISMTFANRIYAQYGADTAAKIRENPYRLAWDVDGIGFDRADRIARSALGFDDLSPQRLEAGVIHALKEARMQGHVYLPKDRLIAEAAKLLKVDDAAAVGASIDRLTSAPSGDAPLIAETGTSVEGPSIYLPSMHAAEIGAACRLRAMLRDDPARSRLRALREVDLQAAIRESEQKSGITLAEQQRKAVETALTSKISVITGGPGTGKSTCLRAVIDVLKQTGHGFVLCAPTGRAAKRLAQATGEFAATIHRTLEFTPLGAFAHNEENPLSGCLIVVDEASMLDLSLFYSLLKAITPETHLLLVGDVDQLPSVGAGDVLRDLIQSGVVPVTRLNVIFRQDETSKIVTNAHAINRGDMPDTANESEDFFFFKAEEPGDAAALIIDLVQNRIPQKFGFHPLDDVQVLTPMHPGPVGVQMLNERLQAALNPPSRLKGEYRIGKRVFRVGDKVMQTVNNYKLGVFNGDIGRVVSVDLPNRALNICIDERTVRYEGDDLDDLVLAYACTIHKAQGSEYPVVVMPVVTQHFYMLARTLIYTGVTRAKKVVVLVGTRKAIAIAVSNDKVARRYSALVERLRARQP